MDTKYFDTGSLAYSRATNGSQGGTYPCPLCLRHFDTSKGLSEEHAPPKAVGGRPLVVTCIDCNSVAGSQIDADWAKHRKIADFALGRMTEVKMDLLCGDLRIPCKVTASDQGVKVAVSAKAMDPRRLDSLQSSFRSALLESGTIQLEFPTYNDRNLRVSRLKSAYLVAFAKFGYRYIRDLELVRRQIASPSEAVISKFQANVDSFAEPQLGCGFIPGIGDFVFVRFDNALVFLPPAGVDNEADFWAKVEASAVVRDRMTFEGSVIPWPNGPEHFFDADEFGPTTGYSRG